MELLTANLAGRVRRETFRGRPYLVAPLRLIVPGVLNGSNGPLLYPPEEVARDPAAWDGVPLLAYHPRGGGSAGGPGVYAEQGVGHVRNPRVSGGALDADGWFDEGRVRRVEPRVYAALLAGEPVELSTGLYTRNEPALPGAAHADGRAYTHVARDYRPDHVAVLPDQAGACSIRDGCGVLMTNAADPVAALSAVLANARARDARGRFARGPGGGAGAGKKSKPANKTKGPAARARGTAPARPTATRGRKPAQPAPPPAGPGETKARDFYASRAPTNVTRWKDGSVWSSFGTLRRDSLRKGRRIDNEAEPMTKPELVDWLVTNCSGWRGDGDRDLLDALPDAKLAELRDAELRANAARKPMWAEDDEDEDEEDGPPAKVKKKMAKNADLSVGEWLDLMPDEARPVWNAARAVEREAREEATRRLLRVAKLTKNSKKRERITNALAGDLPLDRLRELLDLADEPAAGDDPDPPARTATYPGDAGATANARGESNLDIPEVEYENPLAGHRARRATA